MRRPSPSLVVATVAVVLAAGGTGYAAAELTKNSVRSKHIKNGQVKRADLGRNAVDSRRIVNGSVAAADLAPSAKVAGPTGPAGPRGEAMSGPVDVKLISPNPVPVTGQVSTAPVDEQRFSRYQQAFSGSGTAFNCSVLTSLPAGKLLIEKVHVQSTAALHTYLDIPVYDSTDAPVHVPLTLHASGERYLGTLDTGLVIHDGATGRSKYDMYRGEAIPNLELCVQDETATGTVASGWIISGRVLP